VDLQAHARPGELLQSADAALASEALLHRVYTTVRARVARWAAQTPAHAAQELQRLADEAQADPAAEPADAVAASTNSLLYGDEADADADADAPVASSGAWAVSLAGLSALTTSAAQMPLPDPALLARGADAHYRAVADTLLSSARPCPCAGKPLDAPPPADAPALRSAPHAAPSAPAPTAVSQCLRSGVQAAVSTSLLALGPVRLLVAKARCIATVLAAAPVLAHGFKVQCLRAELPFTTLPLDDPADWASTLFMMERVALAGRQVNHVASRYFPICCWEVNNQRDTRAWPEWVDVARVAPLHFTTLQGRGSFGYQDTARPLTSINNLGDTLLSAMLRAAHDNRPLLPCGACLGGDRRSGQVGICVCAAEAAELGAAPLNPTSGTAVTLDCAVLHLTERECQWLLEIVGLLRGLLHLDALADGPDRALAPAVLHHTLRGLSARVASHTDHTDPAAMEAAANGLLTGYKPEHMDAYLRRHDALGRVTVSLTIPAAEQAAIDAAEAWRRANPNAPDAAAAAAVAHSVLESEADELFEDPSYYNASEGERRACSPVCLFARLLRFQLLGCAAVRDLLAHDDELALVGLLADPRTRQLGWLGHQDRLRAYGRVVPYLAQWCVRGAPPAAYGNARNALRVAHDVRLACYNPANPRLDTGLEVPADAPAPPSRLAHLWDGRVYSPPSPSASASAKAALTDPAIRAARYFYFSSSQHVAAHSPPPFDAVYPAIKHIEARARAYATAQRRLPVAGSSTRSRAQARAVQRPAHGCSWTPPTPAAESAPTPGPAGDQMDRVVRLLADTHDPAAATERQQRVLAEAVTDAVVAHVCAAVAAETGVCPRALQLHLERLEQLPKRDRAAYRRAHAASPALGLALELYSFLLLDAIPELKQAAALAPGIAAGAAPPALDVSAWWRDHAAAFPALAPVARHVLTARLLLPPRTTDNPADIFDSLAARGVRAPAHAAPAASLHTIGDVRDHLYLGHHAREAPTRFRPHTLDTECPAPVREAALLCATNSAAALDAVADGAPQ
jgi:hypothetical protein